MIINSGPAHTITSSRLYIWHTISSCTLLYRVGSSSSSRLSSMQMQRERGLWWRVDDDVCRSVSAAAAGWSGAMSGETAWHDGIHSLQAATDRPTVHPATDCGSRWTALTDWLAPETGRKDRPRVVHRHQDTSAALWNLLRLTSRCMVVQLYHCTGGR